MMLKTMDEINAIEPALLDITTAEPLDLVARSPQELFDLLTGEKGALAPPVERTRNAGVTVSAREGFVCVPQQGPGWGHCIPRTTERNNEHSSIRWGRSTKAKLE